MPILEMRGYSSQPPGLTHLCLSIPKSFQFCLMILVENIKSGTRIQNTFALLSIPTPTPCTFSEAVNPEHFAA